MLNLAIIIVSWNVRDLLRRCLHSIDESLAATELRYTVIVVDNASSDGSPTMLRSEFPQVELLESGANLGFAGGNNIGLRHIAGRTEMVLLLNPDTEMRGGAIVELLASLQAHPQWALVGPLLRYPDGEVQSSRRRLPRFATYFWESTLLERLWPGNPWAARYRCADLPADQAQTVEWLVGAALLVRWSAIERAGLLDERFFMYSEELEWQARLGRFGAIGYWPQAEITHYEGKSSEQALVGRHLNFQRSKILLARIRHGWALARSLACFLQLCYWADLLAEQGKAWLGHRVDLRRERIAVYRAVITGLKEEPR